MNPEALFQLFPDGIYLIPEKSGTQKLSSEKSETSIDIDDSSTDSNTTSLAIKGNNRKEVLLLLNDPSHLVIDPEQEILLMKMMGAVSLTLDDIAIVNLAHITDEITLKKIPCKKALLFNTNSFSWCNGTYYKIYTRDNRTLINCHALPVIESDNELKRSLWHAMKQMFKAQG